ncbi:MAG: flagellar biosynthetic protein FliO [Planctomycetia bacterium]|nr:flagellar biosynthetic protein FliO [Planctomycetia bacterium]
MTRSRPTVVALAMVVMVGVVVTDTLMATRLVRADPPVAPGPESVLVDAHIAPATLVADPVRTADDPRPGPVSLGPADGAPASPPRSIRPLPDWKLLAAMGAAFAAIAGYRLLSTRRTVTLPPDVFEVLGEAPLGGQQSVRVVRFGPRTLLVGVSSAGCQTLAELTDPQATDCIVAACRGTRLRTPTRASARTQARGAGPSAAEARA